MIVARAPLRISFFGGGTDLPDFYHRYPGRVLSVAIDKYVYVAVNRTPLIDKVSARYSVSETVEHPSQLQHSRIKAALLDLGIHKNIEIASFASLPSKTGLGSSSTFSVALLKGLNAFLGKKIERGALAEAASRLEIELVGEPIGKQDQYAAAFGGINVFEFWPDDTVGVQPLLLDFKKRLDLQNHLLLFFTGITRNASSVLTEQKANIDTKFATLKEMSDSVPHAVELVMSGDIEGLGRMLHQAWLKKRSLASNVSTSSIDQLYEAGLQAGAWGGKVVGAGGGGCVLFLAPSSSHEAVRSGVASVAKTADLQEFRELPVRFVQSGVELLFHGNKQDASILS